MGPIAGIGFYQPITISNVYNIVSGETVVVVVADDVVTTTVKNNRITLTVP